LPFKNTLTDGNIASTKEEPMKEVKKNVVKIEYRLQDRQEKTIECKMIQSTYPVTKGFTERQKEERVAGIAFGVDKTPDEIRNNVGVTIV